MVAILINVFGNDDDEEEEDEFWGRAPDASGAGVLSAGQPPHGEPAQSLRLAVGLPKGEDGSVTLKGVRVALELAF